MGAALVPFLVFVVERENQTGSVRIAWLALTLGLVGLVYRASLLNLFASPRADLGQVLQGLRQGGN